MKQQANGVKVIKTINRYPCFEEVYLSVKNAKNLPM